MTEKVEFKGESFAVAEKIAAMSLMKYAKVAQRGVSSVSMEGLAATYDLIEQCIAADDWARFQAHAEKVKADGDDLLGVIREVFAIVADRPTGPQSVSSTGPRTIEPSSEVVSSSPAMDATIHRFNQEGRGDLAFMVKKRQESLSA